MTEKAGVGATSLNITTFSIMTLSMKACFMTLSITTTYFYDECRCSFIVMLNDIMLSVVRVSVIMPSVVAPLLYFYHILT
jgi:hypothetical protein